MGVSDGGEQWRRGKCECGCERGAKARGKVWGVKLVVKANVLAGS